MCGHPTHYIRLYILCKLKRHYVTGLVRDFFFNNTNIIPNAENHLIKSFYQVQNVSKLEVNLSELKLSLDLLLVMSLFESYSFQNGSFPTVSAQPVPLAVVPPRLNSLVLYPILYMILLAIYQPNEV